MTEATCSTCALVARRDAGAAPAWDSIHRTAHWDLVHAFGTSLEGWLVLVSRRHVEAVADLSDAEAAELGPLLRETSRALHEAVGASKTYVAQLAEHPDHRHVHVHVVARRFDHPPERIGPAVFDALLDPPTLEVSETRRNEIAAAVRAVLHGST